MSPLMNKKYKYLIIVFLIVASFAAFGRIMANDFINFDDDVYITENNPIKSGINAEIIKWAFTATVSNHWHPLTLLSHALDWTLFGANASGHHLVSLLLHIGAVLFLFLFLEKTTKSIWPSAFVAAVFALHPLRVESVAWAASRKDVLSMFFGMAALYAYAFYVQDRKIFKYLFCLILFILGLLSKPMLVTLPFALLLIDYWPLGRWQEALYPQNNTVAVVNNAAVKKKKQFNKNNPPENKLSFPIQSRGKLIGKLLWEKAPFFILAILSSIVTIWAQSKSGAIASLEKLPLLKRLSNAILSYVSYLGKTFWPSDLAVFYPYEKIFSLWQVFGGALLLLAISITTIFFIKRAAFLFVGWFWYLGTLIPLIGLLQVSIQPMADRYTYLPSIGIGIMLAWGIPLLLKSEEMRIKRLFPAGIISLVVLAVLSWQQCGYWKNSVSLFNHTLQSTKDNYLAHTNFGVALDAEGKKDQAFAHYLSALKINPNYDKAHYNLAMAYKEQGKIEASLKHFQETLSSNPKFPDAHNNIGIILEKYFKKYDEAIYHYEQELEIAPDNSGTHFNLGIALAMKGNLKEAEENFRQAINLKPDYKEAKRALQLAIDMQKKQRVD
jgi:tetratricopeptide (TPR) repeat protein